MYNINNKKIKYRIIVIAILLLVIVLGMSYALLTYNATGKKDYLIAGRDLSIILEDSSNGNLTVADTIPLPDHIGLKQTGYNFTIKSDYLQGFSYDISVVNNSDNTINDDNIIKYAIREQTSNDYKIGLLGETENRIIYSDSIEYGEAKSYNLKFWFDEMVTNEQILDKVFSVKLVVNSKQMIKDEINLYKLIKANSLGDESKLINYSENSSTSGTNGVYMTTKSEGNVPVYFYRGKVDNNLIFAGYCWKIIRTTETGGVKIIYNGTPTSDRKCKPNFTAGTETAQSGTLVMSSSSAYYYGTSYTFNETTGVYSLAGTITSGKWSNSSEFTNKYTCKSTSQTGTCSTLYKIKGYSSTTAVTYSTLPRIVNTDTGTSMFNSNNNDNAYVGYMYGQAGATTYAETHANTNNSTMKIYLEGTNDTDGWFNTSGLKNFQEKLEDSVFCNDRSTVDGTTNNTLNSSYGSSYGTLGYAKNQTGYGALARSSYLTISPNPTYACPQANDKFTVSTETGNGKLKYPVGLITLDEAIFAGFNAYSSNSSNYYDTNNYLYTGQYYWTFSPVFYYSNGGAIVGRVGSAGYVDDFYVYLGSGVRPVVSLAHGTQVEVGGTGTSENPYVVK